MDVKCVNIAKRVMVAMRAIFDFRFSYTHIRFFFRLTTFDIRTFRICLVIRRNSCENPANEEAHEWRALCRVMANGLRKRSFLQNGRFPFMNYAPQFLAFCNAKILNSSVEKGNINRRF